VYAEPSLLFRGASGGKFTEVRPRGGTAVPLIASGRAAAFGDIDNDGGVDVVVVNRDHAPFVLHNIVPKRGHWLSLRVLEPSGRDSIGAQVTATIGDRRVTRSVRAAYSYLASNDPRVHLGLGTVTKASNVSVRWPNGTTEMFGDRDADRVETLQRGKGKPGGSKP
jgi:hypothetical protein